MTETNGKESCRVCHGMYASAYMSTHMRKSHGIYGGKSGRVRRNWPATQQASRYEQAQVNGRRSPDMIVVPTVPPPHPNPQFKVVPMIVLEDQDGGLWLAERLK